MKYADALIAWTPGDDNCLLPGQEHTRGTVKVGRLLKTGQPDWTDPYAFTGGAAYTHVRDARGDTALACLFIEFQTIVVRDKIDPAVAHKAFWQIEEYRNACASDCPNPFSRAA